MIIGTGAGTRARQAYSVGIDLGMPTGVLSILGTFVSMQNARMLHYLLAKHGIPFIEPVQFAQLPFYLEERRGVIDRKSTRLNSSHANISYAVFCLKKKKRERTLR